MTVTLRHYCQFYILRLSLLPDHKLTFESISELFINYALHVLCIHTRSNLASVNYLTRSYHNYVVLIFFWQLYNNFLPLFSLLL